MVERIILDMLTQDSVSVKTQKYTVIEGIEYTVGQPHRKTYINSIRGRQEAEIELPDAQKNAVFAIWGDVPTVIE
jgi:hypothetical protein